MSSFQKIIQDISEELNIKMKVVSKGWVIILEKNGTTRFIIGQKFDLNSHAIGLIMDDKYAMFEVLSENNIPTIQYQILYRPDIQKEYARNANHYELAEQYFIDHGESIVIKPNFGLSGRDVYHITKKEDIIVYLDKVFQNNETLSLCPFYNIRAEYRLIILDNECLLIYGKKKPVVYGDGKRTIRELLQEFNPYYFNNNLSDSFYNKVLKPSEKYEYSWKFNLAEGAVPFSIQDAELKEQLLNILNDITSKFYLGFCSLDIIETIDHEFYIMELNSGVSLNKYSYFFENSEKTLKEIYKKAIQNLFR